MQDNFLAKISHEVRTPINAIIGLGFLFQQTRLDDQQRKYLTTIVDSAQNLLVTFQGILDYTTTEEGALTLNELPFYLDTVLNNISETVNLRCQEKGLKFQLTTASNVPAAFVGDAIRVSQILLNVTNNAVKFTHKGEIKIHVAMTADNALQVTVSDTGIGIPDALKEEIFEPFIQVDNSHTRNYGGAGLGLATCMQLVQHMNGSITVADNTKSGSGGSVFTVTLPLVEAEEAVIVQSGPLSGKKVLILDYDSVRLQVMHNSMLSLGLESETCNDSEKAIKIISAADTADTPYDFVIMAWQMPGMDSIEAAKYIQKLSVKHPLPMLLLFSNYALDEMEQTALDVGFFTFIQTPASPEIFNKALIDASQKQQELIAATDASEEVGEEGPIHILLVEDNEINQEIAYEVLTSAEYTVDIANNGQEAVDAVEKTKYSLVLMDIQMPVLDGLEATKRIRAAGHKMPIIAMTAHGMADDRETSLSAGMNAHLTKPLEPMALFSTITSLLPTAAAPVVAKKETPAEDAQIVREKLPNRLEGFNLENGLAAVAGNEALYINLLRKFADRYATINKDISDCLKQNDVKTAMRHAHTIRGIAANLGAEALASAAETLEKAIMHSPAMTTPLLRTLVVRLTEAVDAIHNCFGSSTTNVDAQAITSVDKCLNLAEREHATHVLGKAIASMEQDWGHATDTANYLLERLRNTEAEKDLLHLKQAIEDFEVEAALELSKKIQKVLHTS